MRRCLVVVLCLLLLSGCWDYKDLNKLSIVTGMAFDKPEDGDGLKVTLEITDRSSAPKDEELRTRTVSAEGDNTDTALKKLARGLEFELYYGAAVVVLFGKDVDVDEPMAWLSHNREMRETVYVIYAEDAGAKLHSEEDGGIAAFKLRDILEASEDGKPLELYKMGVGAK